MRNAAHAIASRAAAVGIAYVEVLVAVVLMAVALVPALDALGSGIKGAAVHSALAQAEYALQSHLENVLAEPFAILDAEAVALGSETTPSSYSEAPGTPQRVLVYLARYDGDDADADDDPFTGGDDGLLWVQVAIENSVHGLHTLTTR